MELKLPELGENIDQVDVSAVLVAVGDEVQRDQPVIEVETEKASLEVPATCAGRVQQLLVSKGDKVAVGQVILIVDSDTAGEAAPETGRASAASAVSASAAAEEAAADEEVAAEDVASESAVPEMPRKQSTADAPTAAAPRQDAAGDRQAASAHETAETEASQASPAAGLVAFRPAKRGAPEIGRTVPAAPSVRMLARQLGVDIFEVRGRGPGGRIGRDDVMSHAKRLIQAGPASAGAASAPALPDFTAWGPVKRETLSSVRRATARHMADAWSTIPHVTQFDRADVTQLESMRKSFNVRPEAAGRKLTVTALVIKLASQALRKFPEFNASLDLPGQAVVYKGYVSIGVAVDTERGLLVPVLRDVDRKGVLQVAAELNELAELARGKKLRPEQMQGATFTVSNLGGLGTTYFSPIVNWPEVAILGVGRAELQAVPVEGQFEPRLILPLSLSYDHRLIDGADAARFLHWMADALEQPLLLLLQEGDDLLGGPGS